MQRIKYYDLLRIICFTMVISYHMLVHLVIDGVYDSDQVAFLCGNPNITFSSVAVSVFFMLSGAGLTIRTSSEFKILEFYKSRFLKIMIPFYVADLILYISRYIIYKENWFAHMVNPRYIFTILGIDEWLSMHGVQTCTSHIGEWFLGLLLIMYLLFPLFRLLMNKYPYFFLALSASIYLVFTYNYRSGNPAVNMTFFTKVFEFIVGMYFGKYMRSFPKKLMVITLPVCSFLLLNPWKLEINYSLLTTITAIALFTSVSYAEPILQKREYGILKTVSGFSYYMFLTHHAVIFIVSPWLDAKITSKYQTAFLMLFELVLTIVTAIPVKVIADCVVKLIKSLPQKATVK